MALEEEEVRAQGEGKRRCDVPLPDTKHRHEEGMRGGKMGGCTVPSCANNSREKPMERDPIAARREEKRCLY